MHNHEALLGKCRDCGAETVGLSHVDCPVRSEKKISVVVGPDLVQRPKKLFRHDMAVRAWNRTNGNASADEETGVLTKALSDRLTLFSVKDLLFYFKLTLDPAEGHQVKKNRRNIGFNQKLGRMILGKSPELVRAERQLIGAMQLQAREQKITQPFTGRLWMMALFYFPLNRYFTKDGQISKTLPDLSNLLELPQDCLQAPRICQTGKRKGKVIGTAGAGVIENDNQIDCYDGSRRLPGTDYKIEIFLLRYRGHEHGPTTGGRNGAV